MKKVFRVVTFLLLVGGWSLAGAALHVVRTPARVIVTPKNRLGFHDTYVDTRNWTIENVREHSAVAARIVAIGKADLLAHAVDDSSGNVEAQLVDAIEHPVTAPPSTQPAIVEKVKAEVHAATQTVQSVFD